jgi:hypothetical protein
MAQSKITTRIAATMEDIKLIFLYQLEISICHYRSLVFAISLIDSFLILLENLLSNDLLSCSHITLSIHE